MMMLLESSKSIYFLNHQIVQGCRIHGAMAHCAKVFRFVNQISKICDDLVVKIVNRFFFFLIFMLILVWYIWTVQSTSLPFLRLGFFLFFIFKFYSSYSSFHWEHHFVRSSRLDVLLFFVVRPSFCCDVRSDPPRQSSSLVLLLLLILDTATTTPHSFLKTTAARRTIEIIDRLLEK